MPRLLTRLAAPLLLALVSACGASAARAPRPLEIAHAAEPAAPVVERAPVERAAVDRAAVRDALAERRSATFERFLAYRERRVYPVNSSAQGFRHVWLDELGNLCAAATIISADWGREATARVAREDNSIALASVADGPLMDWILTSGLTHQEIVAIQVPGWDGGLVDVAPVVDPREQEVARLYALYIDVERQLKSLWDENLELAVDRLLKRPDLARDLVAGRVAGAGRFARDAEPIVVGGTAPSRFAEPPPG